MSLASGYICEQNREKFLPLWNLCAGVGGGKALGWEEGDTDDVTNIVEIVLSNKNYRQNIDQGKGY